MERYWEGDVKAYAGEKQSDMGFMAEGLHGLNDKSNATICETFFGLPKIVSNANNHQPSCALVILTVNPYNLDLIHHRKKT